MKFKFIKSIKEKVTLKFILICLLILGLGFAFLIIASIDKIWESHRNLQIVLNQIGALFFVTVVISFLWELVGKRIFLEEVLAKVGISIDIKSLGITKVTNDFYEDIDWSELFSNVKELDIFFCYARTWRNLRVMEFNNLAANKNAQIRVVLPDPDNERVMKELSTRFNITEAEVKTNIEEAKDFFSRLRTGEEHAKIDIWYLPVAPSFALYRFDKVSMITLYSHTRERGGLIPTFVFERGGTLFNYANREFDMMVRNGGYARKITEEG